MAINRQEHPITDQEIIDCLEKEAERLLNPEDGQKRFGDKRPELFKAAAERIRQMPAEAEQ